MTQQYREVKRKANVGERIRVVEAEDACEKYANGDEFVVDRLLSTDVGVVVDAVKSRGAGNIGGIINNEEYVVLEPISVEPPLNPAEQLEALRKQQADLSAEILTLEDEARRAAEIKVGDYVQITKSNAADGCYGKVALIVDSACILPFGVRTFPYNSLVHVYEVRRVSADEIRTFLYESAASLS